MTNDQCPTEEANRRLTLDEIKAMQAGDEIDEAVAECFEPRPSDPPEHHLIEATSDLCFWAWAPLMKRWITRWMPSRDPGHALGAIIEWKQRMEASNISTHWNALDEWNVILCAEAMTFAYCEADSFEVAASKAILIATHCPGQSIHKPFEKAAVTVFSG